MEKRENFCGTNKKNIHINGIYYYLFDWLFFEAQTNIFHMYMKLMLAIIIIMFQKYIMLYVCDDDDLVCLTVRNTWIKNNNMFSLCYVMCYAIIISTIDVS